MNLWEKLSQVTADEFCELAISPRTLIRIDDPDTGLRGLQDVDTGETFVVEELALGAYALS